MTALQQFLKNVVTYSIIKPNNSKAVNRKATVTLGVLNKSGWRIRSSIISISISRSSRSHRSRSRSGHRSRSRSRIRSRSRRSRSSRSRSLKKISRSRNRSIIIGVEG